VCNLWPAKGMSAVCKSFKKHFKFSDLVYLMCIVIVGGQ
jgi:hypothetical protein